MDPINTKRPKLKSGFDRALRYASKLHRTQIREGGKVKAFREVGPHLMAEELGRVVTQLERLAARRAAQRRSPPRQGRRAG